MSLEMKQPIITIRDLSVTYDTVRALEHVDLDIYADDFLGIIGPNGGGKSTLVKAIMGVVPYSGDILFGESLMRHKKPHIGYLPQISSFDKAFPISVEEVVMSGLQAERGVLRGYGKEERERVDSVLSRAHLIELKKRSIGELSGGQLQRVMLCRAIISKPKLLVLDEPANFVDNRFENELYTLLRKLNEQMAIVMVSHDIGTITSSVKSIVCVNRTVHRHDSNIITQEQLDNYNCPIQIVSHGHVPHTVLAHHDGDGCKCGHHK